MKGVIVWINGPFGVGKSTVAEAISRARPEAMVFDPELLGFFIRQWQPAGVEVDDFQDLTTWRRLVVGAAVGLVRDFGRPLIVPMTLLNAEYFDEIVGGIRAEGIDVRHFCLVASRREVLRRVAARGDTGEWFPRKFDEYAGALSDPRFATRIETEERSIEAVVAEIVGSLPVSA